MVGSDDEHFVDLVMEVRTESDVGFMWRDGELHQGEGVAGGLAGNQHPTVIGAILEGCSAIRLNDERADHPSDVMRSSAPLHAFRSLVSVARPAKATPLPTRYRRVPATVVMGSQVGMC